MTWREIGRLFWRPDAFAEPRPLCAGSGLVNLDGALWIVADDLHHVVRVDRDGALVGSGQRIFPGELPEEYKARKRAKPDTECLIALPSKGGGERLLAFPSGSKRHRVRAATIDLNAEGAVSGITESDLSALLHFLDDRLPDLNIEGGVTRGDDIVLLQRGNGKAGFNALISFPLETLESSLVGGFDANTFRPSIREFPLPSIDGARLTFTDATLLDGVLYFAAAAERSESTYEDGAVAGSAIGRIDAAASILTQIDRIKVEGLTRARSDAQSATLFAVTDADDATVPSLLLEAQILR